MYEPLENYLEDIDHLLVVPEGRQEILDEIKSHILERAQDDTGQITGESLKRAISLYGSPQQVASKYVGDYQIISPTYKKYLIRYTAILFAAHLCLLVLASLFKTNVYLFPFFFIPRLDVIHLLNFIPMALLYDLGLVGLVLYVVTQRNKDIKLPWVKLKFLKPIHDVPGLKRPKFLVLLVLGVGYGLVLAVFVKYGTLFFYSLNLKEPKPFFGPVASLWYSLALLFVFGVAFLAYVMRFIVNSRWVELAKYAMSLLVFFLVINIPIADAFSVWDHPDLKTMIMVIVGFFALLYSYEFLKNFILIVRGAFKPRQPGPS